MTRLALALVLTVFCALEGRAQESLADRINAVINGPDYKQAHWGVLVVDAKSGETVYEHNPDKLFTPASTTKLYTTAAALAAFGPQYKFETPVYRRGDVSDGRLRGDLILVASGDLTMGGRTLPDGKMAFANSDHTYAGPTTTEHELTNTNPLAGLAELAQQVQAAGIRVIQGDILIDDRLFPHARGSGSGPDLLTPIVVNDNVVDLTVTPGDGPNQLASIKMRPETSWVRMDAQVVTAEKGVSPQIDVVPTGPQSFTARGRIALGSKPLVRVWPVDDPAEFARALFIEELRRHGVTVLASPHAKPTAALPEKEAYAKLTRVALFTSPPLAEVVKVTLKVSHNLYASTLPLLVAAKNNQASIADGLRWQRRFMVELGVPVETISFAGGAGGANADCTTPRATVKLLQAMRPRKEYTAWHDGFPILGVDEQSRPRQGAGEDRHAVVVRRDEQPHALAQQGARRHGDDSEWQGPDSRDVRQRRATTRGCHDGTRRPHAGADLRDHLSVWAIKPVDDWRPRRVG
jgi:D-alanyl-D-alanine carboxypeptidase/D-alanyl-D-alanine-endopeptidase (penicillin-binding protein 4)